MPIYEYQCQHCDHTFDTLQKVSEKPLIKCPECGEDTLKKLVSPAGFRLKGTGWYETDFKGSKNKSETAKSDKKDAGSSTKKTSESKTTATTASD